MPQKTHLETVESARSQRGTILVDAKDQVVGRIATKVATILRGKDKPTYTPHVDCGEAVIIINADKIKFTGSKLDSKLYRHHTGYIGSVKEITARKRLATKPERILYDAIQGMLPKTKLGDAQLSKLRVYAGETHPHIAQKPEVTEI